MPELPLEILVQRAEEPVRLLVHRHVGQGSPSQGLATPHAIVGPGRPHLGICEILALLAGIAPVG
eukprot:5043784-Pyramimonas_sp.AAC.1